MVYDFTSCPLASTFPAGAIVVFIPWCRGAPRRLARRISTKASMTRGRRRFRFRQIGAARPVREPPIPIQQIPALRAASMALGRSSCLQLPGRRTSAPAEPAHGAEGSYVMLSLLLSGWRDRGLYPLVQGRRGARGESTASMTRGGGDFVFAQIGAARPARAADFPIEQIPLRAASMALGRSSCLQLPGRRTSAPAASARAGGLSASLSLRHFGPARCCSLSLGGGRRGILARRCSTGAAAGWGAGFLQRNGHRNRGEFSGKAKVGQALEQTICLLLL